MTEFWESNFKEKQTMWGFDPADVAASTMGLFLKNGIREILIPGFGYGRNAKIFTDNGLKVTGIEISETAIALAQKNYGEDLHVYHGNVGDMPFDQKLYDGIFCYALIHLLDGGERAKLIKDCYHQLKPNGHMVFVALSTNSPIYGEGIKVDKDRFRTKHGATLFFYDSTSVQREFGKYGLLEAKEINEPIKSVTNKPPQKFWNILCRKSPNSDEPMFV
ncbi:MAG: class I SAM-dependent methyltransferase [Sediminicola sp.]